MGGDLISLMKEIKNAELIGETKRVGRRESRREKVFFGGDLKGETK